MKFYSREHNSIKNFNISVIEPYKTSIDGYMYIKRTKTILYHKKEKIIIYRDRINFYYDEKLYARFKNNEFKILNKKVYEKCKSENRKELKEGEK